MINFSKITEEFANELKLVDEIITNNCNDSASLISLITQNLINSGGKRIRPLLLIICAKLCGSNNNNDQYLLASALEMIHCATILHDDVIDMSEIRRGKKTANAIWDNKASILVGDYLFSSSFQLMVKSNNMHVLELLSKTSSIIANGEILQLQKSKNIDLSENEYYEIIYGKTAILFESCCEVGAIINNCQQNQRQSLKDFGKNLGMIFQIIDDILDYSSNEKLLGKDIGNDFFEGKITLPIIKTLEKADIKDKKIINELFLNNLSNSNKDYDKLTIILELINKYDTINDVKKIVENHVKLAINSIDNFSITQDNQKYIEYLRSIVQYCQNRIF
jgi:octaprenyl-diphosphate synthase